MTLRVTEAEMQEVAKRVAQNFARGKVWIEEEEAIAEAYVVAVAAVQAWDDEKGKTINDHFAWLAIRVRFGLIDWQRREKQRYSGRQGKSVGDTSVRRIELIDDMPRIRDSDHYGTLRRGESEDASIRQGHGWASAGRIDPGYDFVERIASPQDVEVIRRPRLGPVPLRPNAGQTRLTHPEALTITVGRTPILRGQELSQRELEVLAVAARGLTNTEIGKVLFVSYHTVMTHKRKLLHKLGARSIAHAVALGFESGLLAAPVKEAA